MIDSKPLFQKAFRPAANVLASAGVTANQVTAAAALVSLAAGTAVLALPTARWPLLLIPVALIFRLACNHIDGLLAREHGMRTPLGALLNELADVAADAALYLPLAAVPGIEPRLAVAAAVLGVIVETGGIAAIVVGAERRNDGPASKKPRGVFFGSIALALGLGVPPGAWLDIAFAAALPLLVITVARRVSGALGQTA